LKKALTGQVTLTLFELLEEFIFIEGFEAITVGAGVTTEGVYILAEVETVDVEDAEGETCDVVVELTELDTVLLVVVLMEAEVKRAVPKQAIPPSL